MNILKLIKNKRACRTIEKSGLFDQKYYLKTNADVRLADVDPLLHYLLQGSIEGRKPNNWFDPVWYRSAYQDVTESGIEPFLHYILNGKSEGRHASQYAIDSALLVSPVTGSAEALTNKGGNNKTDQDRDDGVLVSIICRTYNHENFIEKTIDGFLGQNTSFSYEVIIGDDNSSDGTVALLEKIAEEHPDTIRLVLNKDNCGPVKNLASLTNHVRGKYVALCDGDDWWIDPDKLQIQADFLNENKDYSICFHKVAILYEGAEPSFSFYPVQCNETTTSEELICGNYIQTNSVMYRWGFEGGLEKYGFNTNVMPADWYLHLLHSEKGKIKYIDRTMGVYNKHSGGIWVSSTDPLELHKKYGNREIELFRTLKKHFDGKYNELLTRKQMSIMTLLVIDYIENKEIAKLKNLLSSNSDVASMVLESIGYDNHDVSTDNIEQAVKAQLKVSVVVTSYNHKDYIAKCLDSVLAQEGFYEMEIIIGDDYSTDGTDAVIAQYKEKHPDLINVIKSDLNMGMLNNLKRCFEACTGNYIAVCEGDDYWISSSKLKKQISFLMNNDDCAMCFNWLLLYREDNDIFVPHTEQMAFTGNKITFSELAKIPLIGNFSACVYRAEAIRRVPDKYYSQEFAADWLFNMCIADIGKVGFVKELMSVYRIHGGGQWSGKTGSEMQQAIKRTKNIFYEFFGKDKVDKVIETRYSDQQLSSASMVACKDDISMNVEKIEVIGSILTITGWGLNNRTSNDSGTLVGLLFVDASNDEVVSGYQLPMISRTDVKDYFFNRGVSNVPEKCGFSTVLKIEYPGDMFELALSLEQDGKVIYSKTGKYVVRSLNTWKLLTRKEVMSSSLLTSSRVLFRKILPLNRKQNNI